MYFHKTAATYDASRFIFTAVFIRLPLRSKPAQGVAEFIAKITIRLLDKYSPVEKKSIKHNYIDYNVKLDRIFLFISYLNTNNNIYFIT